MSDGDFCILGMIVYYPFYFFYQILHFSVGFMGELAGQLNALANSAEFETVPMTRKRGGECWSTDNDKCNESAVDFEHQVYLENEKVI